MHYTTYFWIKKHFSKMDFTILEFPSFKSKVFCRTFTNETRHTFPDSIFVRSSPSEDTLKCAKLLNPYRLILFESIIIDDDECIEFVNKFAIRLNCDYERFVEGIVRKSRTIIIDQTYFSTNKIENISDYYAQNLSKILQKLNKRGTLKLYVEHLTRDLIMIFWKLSQSFQSISLIREPWAIGCTMEHYWIFKNYKGTNVVETNVLETNVLETNVLETNAETVAETNVLETNAETVAETNVLETNGLEVAEQFKHFIVEFMDKIIKWNERFNEELEKCMKWYEKKTMQTLLTLYNESRIMAMNICFKNDIEVKREFIDEDLKYLLSNKNKINVIKSYFPPHPKRNDIQLSIEATYSVTRNTHNERIVSYLLNQKYDIKNARLIDTTANVGGMTIGLSQWFKKTIAIENDSTNYNFLLHNINIYRDKYGSKITTIKGDCLNHLDVLVQENIPTVVIIDPPWGGNGCYKLKQLNLQLSGVDCNDIIFNIRKKVDYVFLKAPFNFNNGRIKQKDTIEFRNYGFIVY